MSNNQDHPFDGIEIGAIAPDFSVEDVDGQVLHLHSFQGQKHVLLVLNRGFK